MRKQQRITQFAILAPIVVTMALWIWAKLEQGPAFQPNPWQLVSQFTALLAFDLFCIALLIAARNRSIEKIYGGLDKSYLTHGKLARIGFFLMLAHPVLLIPKYAMEGTPVWKLFWFSDFWPRNVGIAAFYLFIVLVLMTMYRFLEYQKWVTSHKLMGVAFTLAAVHVLNAHSDVKNFEPLGDWALFMSIIGIGAWLYKVFLYERLGQQYRYRVSAVNDLGHGLTEINLLPEGKRMNYEPGEFAFLSIRGNSQVPEEAHPFSISSNPVSMTLRFSVRRGGDYTQKLQHVKPGDRAVVHGPYGEFTSYVFDEHKKQIWIGGGIGITPFLSMLSHEAMNDDAKQVWLYYCTKLPEEAVYDGEIKTALERANKQKHYEQIAGFLTAEKVKADVGGDLSDFVVLLCGPPPMMKALKKQFTALGMPAESILFEDFNFV